MNDRIQGYLYGGLTQSDLRPAEVAELDDTKNIIREKPQPLPPAAHGYQSPSNRRPRNPGGTAE